MARRKESHQVEHREGEEDFDGKDGDVWHADEAGCDAVEGEDCAGDKKDAEGCVDEGEVITSGVGGIFGGATETRSENEEIVDAAADPGYGGQVVDPAHYEKENVVKAHCPAEVERFLQGVDRRLGDYRQGGFWRRR